MMLPLNLDVEFIDHKEVVVCGNGACVYIPKKHLGKTAKIIIERVKKND